MTGYEVVISAAFTTSNNNAITGKAVCPAGKKAVGGGYNESTGNGIHAMYIGPAQTNSANDSWQITAARIASDASFKVMAICVSAV